MERVVVKTEPADELHCSEDLEPSADQPSNDANLLHPQAGGQYGDTSADNILDTGYNLFKFNIENHPAMKPKDFEDGDDSMDTIKTEVKEEEEAEEATNDIDSSYNNQISENSDKESQPLDYSVSTTVKNETSTTSDNCAIPSGSSDFAPTNHVVTGAFSCLFPSCTVKFNDHIALLEHLKTHQLHPNQCQICLRMLQDEQGLDKHLALHQYGCTYFCDHRNCGAGFELESQLFAHQESHTPKKRERGEHKCEQCGRVFPFKTHLRRHKREHKLNDPIICTKDECNRKFPTLERLHLHQQNYHGHYECLFCNRVFPIMKKMNQHLRTTHGSNTNFMCTHEGCGKGFKVKDSLRKHLLSHSTEKTYTCEDCGVSFKFDHTLRNHRRQESQNSEYPCNINGCTEVFKKGCMLKAHKAAIHNAKMEVTCRKCGLVLPFRDLQFHNKSMHNLIHSSEKTFKCPVEGCMTMFTSKEGIRVHKRRYHLRRAKKLEAKPSKEDENNIEGSVPCMACGLKFQSDANLEEHQKEDRTLTKPHGCRIKNCRRKYSTKCMLDMHQLLQHRVNAYTRSHHPKRPFRCPFDGCPSRFSHPLYMKRHVIFVHKFWICDNTVPCPKKGCSEMFKYTFLLEEHMVKHNKPLASVVTKVAKDDAKDGELPEPTEKSSDIEPSTSALQRSASPIQSSTNHDEADNAIDARTYESDDSNGQDDVSQGKNPLIKKPIHCPLCNKFCSSMKSVKRHLAKEHHHVTQLLCTYPGCGKVFSKHQNFMGHRRLHIPETEDGMPPLAEVTSKYAEKLPRHFDPAQLPPYHKLCSECGKAFTNRKAYNRHMIVQHRPRNETYVCEHEGCGKTYNVKAYFSKHVREQHSNRPPPEYRCKIPGCDKIYKSSASLSRHNATSHRPGKIPKTKEIHPCNMPSCQAQFTSKDKLRIHMEMHSGRFDCNICGKTLSNNHSLKIHLTHHSTPRNYKCDVDKCNKTFHLEKELRRHIIKYHEEGKRHHCPEPGCTASFYFPCQLPRHLEHHRKGQVFNCIDCNKNFTSYTNLKRHQAVAHGLIPQAKRIKDRKYVECPEPNCQATLGCNSRLRRHLANVHKKVIIQYVCPLERCNAVFTDKSECEDHLRSSHSEEDSSREPFKHQVPVRHLKDSDDGSTSSDEDEASEEDSQDVDYKPTQNSVSIKQENFDANSLDPEAMVALETELSYLAETESGSDGDGDVSMTDKAVKQELL